MFLGTLLWNMKEIIKAVIYYPLNDFIFLAYVTVMLPP